MTVATARSIESNVPIGDDGASRPHRLLDPPVGGPADHLGRAVGWGRGIAATAVAMIVTYAMLAVFMVALGMFVTHVIAHDFVGAWERHVSDWFATHGSGLWNSISAGATFMADTFSVAAVAVVVTVVLLFRKWGRQAFLIVAGLAIELSVFLTSNSVVARPRPPLRHLGGTPSTFSFPSGHTAATVVLYGGIAVLTMTSTTRRGPRIAAWTVAVVLTVAVGVSRVYRGEHYVTDVVAGFLMGVGALVAAVFIIRVAGAAHAAKSHAVDKPVVAKEPLRRSVALR